MKLTQFEQTEKARFLEGRPKFLQKRVKKLHITMGELGRIQHEWALELESKFGVPFGISYHPFHGRHWTRTGFLFADPDWGRLGQWARGRGEKIIEGDEASAEIVEKAYRELEINLRLNPLPIISTGNLWAKSGLTAKQLLGGLKWLWEHQKARPHVNRNGRAIYVTMDKIKRGEQ